MPLLLLSLPAPSPVRPGVQVPLCLPQTQTDHQDDPLDDPSEAAAGFGSRLPRGGVLHGHHPVKRKNITLMTQIQ